MINSNAQWANLNCFFTCRASISIKNKRVMNIEQLREECLKIKGAEENFQFDGDLMVFKVMSKVFAFVSLIPKDGDFFVTMKCNPERSADLREHYEGVTKGYYSGNTLKWNSVYLNRDVPDNLIIELIQHSVDEVISGLSKKMQKEYFEMLVSRDNN